MRVPSSDSFRSPSRPSGPVFSPLAVPLPSLPFLPLALSLARDPPHAPVVFKFFRVSCGG